VLTALGLSLGGQTPLAAAVMHGAIVMVVALLAGLILIHGRKYARLKRAHAETQGQVKELQEQLEDISGSISDVNTRFNAQQTHQGDAIAAELRVLQKLLLELAKQRKPANSNSVSPDAMAQRLADEFPTDADSALDVIRNALGENRVELHLQPIVKLPNRKVSHYEALSRVRDEAGNIVFPRAFLRPAESAGLISGLDTYLLFRCVDLIRRMGPKRPGVRLFCNISSASLADAAFLAEFARFMRDNRMLSDRLVFELRADDITALQPDTREQLAALARLGFPLSIDHVEDFDFDPAEWAQMNVQFVKIEANKLMKPTHRYDPYDLGRYLKRFGIQLIATHVEDERTAIDILDFGVELGQGFLYGEPRAARDGPMDTPKNAA
jgi:cyclic-di-GMP phosphodiesterase, flagellum assembly factor TipF